MGVSPTPVREAFRRLSAEGLVEIVPWKGVVIQSYSEKEIKETYQCRIALEMLAVELAIGKVGDSDIEQLEEKFRKSKTVKTASELFQISTEIHELIIKLADNKKIIQLLENINSLIQHDRNITSYSKKRTLEIHNEHEKIINSIKAKDELKAKQAMKEHIENGYNYIIKMKESERSNLFS